MERKMDIQNKEQWSEAFIEACKNGHLENVRNLCQKQYLDLGWADIHVYGEGGFLEACWNGRLEVVKYLLTSKALIKEGHTFANLHVKNECGLRFACQIGYLDIIKYLLISPELIEAGHAWADVHAREDNGLGLLCKGRSWEVVRWLVLNYGIEKTPEIEKIIQEYPQAQEYFRVRDEFKEMQALIKETSVSHPKDEFELKKDKRAVKKAKKL